VLIADDASAASERYDRRFDELHELEHGVSRVERAAAAVQHDIAVVVIVFDNGAFGNVRRDRLELFDGRVIGADLVNPDFVKFADSFGVSAVRARTPEALRVSLERALASDRPCLIEVPIETGSEVSPWTFLQPAPPKLR